MSSPVPRLPDLDVANPTGSCWTCVERGTADRCDKALPFCLRCQHDGNRCTGYHARLRWKRAARAQTGRNTHVALLRAMSSLGLPPDENRLLLHYVRPENLSRISLAIDYEGNGYLKFASIALNDQALLNALLALSSAHLRRWRGEEDRSSRRHMQKSAQLLRRRLQHPSTATSETTLMTIIILLVFELCEGNERWKHHFNGLLPWLRLRQNCADLDPFLTSLIVMTTSQVLLHMLGDYRERSYQLLETLCVLRPNQAAVDVIYGCSLELPRLIRLQIEAGHIHDDWRAAQCSENSEQLADVLLRAEALQEKIRHSRLESDRLPELNLLTGNTDAAVAADGLWPADLATDRETRVAARASAEIFRHALHVYVFRIIHDPMTTGGCPVQVQSSINQVLELLPHVPDTVGPGSFLGWALVVIGAEVDFVDHREYIKHRLESLTLLSLNHGVLGLSVLDEIWKRRDMIKKGRTNNRRCRWQEVMDDMEVDLALI